MRSIPPASRGHVRTARPLVVQPSERQLLQQPRVTTKKSGSAATWQFWCGEFEVVKDGDEVHIEVRIGRFSDALILKMGEVQPT